jgi:hypothetical protein
MIIKKGFSFKEAHDVLFVSAPGRHTKVVTPKSVERVKNIGEFYDLFVPDLEVT